MIWMAATSKMKDAKSPEEIEVGIKSTQTVKWDPFTILPKHIYLKIFGMLDNLDKQNFMNAHIKWYNLFKSQRIRFLFEKVLKEMTIRDQKENFERNGWQDRKREFENYKHCRLVCHDWDNETQNFFQLHECYFRIDEEKHIWTPSRIGTLGSEWEPCKNFTWFTANEAENDLEIFSLTHPPSKNPFLSRSITLLPFLDEERVNLEMEDIRRYRTAVDAILEKFGRHVWHCKIKITNKLDPEASRLISKWLGLMPELKTLRLDYEKVFDLFSKAGLEEIEDMQLVQPELKKLIFLKSSDFPAVIFNKLFGNLNDLEKIQIKFSSLTEEGLRDFVIGDRRNLREAFLAIKGLEDFEYLESSEMFPSMKKLVTTLEFEGLDEEEFKYYEKWPEWKLIFKVLEERFPELEELTLRLPKIFSKQGKRTAIEHSLVYQLNLPKLKKLWINLPNMCSLDFLRPCLALEKLKVVLEHSEWSRRSSMNWRRLRSREKIKFNTDLKNMWESNIWEVFPKLNKLKILGWYEGADTIYDLSGIDRYRYEKSGEERKYFQWTYAERQKSVDYSSCLDIDRDVFSDSD